MFFWTSLSFSQREVPLCSSACPPGGAAVLFVFASSQSFLFLPFLTVLPPFLLSNSMVFHPSWLPSYWFLPMSTSNTESHNAILALIKTPTGFHESFCPDVQELMSPDLWLHMSWPSLDVPPSVLLWGEGKNMKGFLEGSGFGVSWRLVCPCLHLLVRMNCADFVWVWEGVHMCLNVCPWKWNKWSCLHMKSFLTKCLAAARIGAFEAGQWLYPQAPEQL